MKTFRAFWISLLCVLAAGCHDSSDSDSANPTPAPPPLPENFDPFVDYGVFLSVLPAGQSTSESGQGNEDNFDDQAIMYENLAFTQPGELVTEEDLVGGEFYKDGDVLPPDSEEFVDTVEVSNDQFSATIGFDRFGVPHIFGETRGDVYFGSGYVTAQDRPFVADVLRHVGRGRLSDFLGPGAGNFNQDRSIGKVAGYDEQEIQDQIVQLAARFGTTGTQIQMDSQAFVAGYNTRLGEVRDSPPAIYTAFGVPMRDWTVRDILAVATLVQATFAVGGGSEHLQAQIINTIENEFVEPGNLTAREACDLWRDIRHADDPEKPLTAEGTFATQSPPTLPEQACPFDASFATEFPGTVIFDDGSLANRQLLQIEECADGIVLPACPDRGDSVVDDDVENELSASARFQGAPETLIASIGDSALIELLPAEPNTARAEQQPRVPFAHDRLGVAAYRAYLDRVAERGLAQVAALNRALSGGLDFPEMASNALLVKANQTELGHPIAVFGPQTGYFVPNLLYEMSQQGGDVNVRGMSFAGLPYVVIGRGVDFAWSATSAGDDIIDVRVVKLCDPAGESSRGYMHNGTCKELFERVDTWTAEANPVTALEGELVDKKVTRTILRAPEYGPIFATATVNGESVGLAIQRSTFFGEVDSAVPFVAISRNEIIGPESFFDVFNTLTGTFNWFYVDANDIAYFNSGLLPKRADGIHPDLPTWGNGSFDWAQTGTGRLNPDFSFDNFLPLEAHPRDKNPNRGYIANWNNSQAAGFWANDGQTSYGPVDRQELLARRHEAFIDAGNKHTPGTLVEIMIDAGTTDLRGQEVVSSALAVLATATTPELTGDQQTAVDILSAWVANGTRNLGAMRRDRDGPGQDTSSLQYEDRAAAVFMDTWWDHLIDKVLPQITALEVGGSLPVETRHDLPNDIGSAFNGGYYGYVQRVLDMALNNSANPYKTLRCAGSSGECRQAVINSLQLTLEDLGSDPAGWDGTDNANGSDPADTREQDDAISFSQVGIPSTPDIHWQNRPTFQQVVQPVLRRQPASE